jgi:uncharacterized protein (TIGR00290 family)
MKKKALVCWSGGKDCMLALWEVREQYEIVALLTTVTRDFGRVSMHGVRTSLLEAQAAALGLPLWTAEIGHRADNAEYEEVMRDALARGYEQGAQAVVCGDLFLQDVRRYREERLLRPGTGVFPLWGLNTHELARRFLALGFRAVLCCVDTQALDGSFAGRAFDESLLADLPAGVDPCGENGEFHTFVHDGPLFTQPVRITDGERVLRDERFMYCDLVPELAVCQCRDR